MNEQEKRENVIKGLQEAVDWLSTETSLTVVDQWVVRDALALLKAQEPRVMTLEEYKALAEKPKEERDPVWEEWPGLVNSWAIPDQSYGGYGTSWRCWTSRPDEKRRAETPWS